MVLSRCYVKWMPQAWEGAGPFCSLRELPLYMAEIPSARPGTEAFRTHHQSIARIQPSTRVLGRLNAVPKRCLGCEEQKVMDTLPSE